MRDEGGHTPLCLATTSVLVGSPFPPTRVVRKHISGCLWACSSTFPHHSTMRLPILLSLLSLATWAASSPAGGGAVEELGGAVEQAATSASPAAWRPELEDLSSFVSPGRAAWRKYLATLSTHPPPPLRLRRLPNLHARPPVEDSRAYHTVDQICVDFLR